MVNFIVWLVLGGIIGWLASMVMRTDGQSVLLNVVVGVIGAFLGGWLLSPLFGGTASINQGDFSIPGLIVSFLGALILLAIVNLFRKNAIR